LKNYINHAPLINETEIKILNVINIHIEKNNNFIFLKLETQNHQTFYLQSTSSIKNKNLDKILTSQSTWHIKFFKPDITIRYGHPTYSLFLHPIHQTKKELNHIDGIMLEYVDLWFNNHGYKNMLQNSDIKQFPHQRLQIKSEKPKIKPRIPSFLDQ